MGIAEVARCGDRLQTLLAVRDMLAAELDGAAGAPRDVAALALRFTDVLQQIDDVPSSRQVSAADEIAQRRAARRGGGAKDSARAAGAQ